MQQISAKELINEKDDSILILDIRDSNTFNEWHIPGSQNINVSKEIADGNLEKAKEKLSQLPRDKTIVTVCHAGISSQKAADVLDSLGYKTVVLEKGMIGWNRLHQAIDIINEGDLLVKQIIRPGKGCLSYLIGSNSKKEVFVVDPSQYVEYYVNIVRDMEYTIKGVIETHAHADHVSGAKILANMTKTKYYISGEDFTAIPDFVGLKDNIQIGDINIQVINTPGHTLGSVCLIVNNKAILTGDTLFLEGVGRPDLGREKEQIDFGAKTLFSSLNKIKGLNKDLIVLPGHFSDYGAPPFSEKLSNVLEHNNPLQLTSEQEFVDYIVNNLPSNPPNYEQIKEINITPTQLPIEQGEKLEFGPNRCASK